MEDSMKYQILISGSPDRDGAPEKIYKTAEATGVALAETGHTLIVDEMHGVSYRAAVAAHEKTKKSLIIGLSPAANRYEHTSVYQLPTTEFDFLQFTGGEYVGRTTLAVRSADAVIIVGGEAGALHQVATALELGKVCGVVVGSGGVADFVPRLIESIAPHHRKLLVSDSNPSRIIKKVVELLDLKYSSAPLKK